MAKSARWIRLDVSWDDTEWLADLTWPTRAVWPLVLAHVKLHGQAGVCTVNVKRFCVAHDVPLPCVELFLEAAVRAGAMEIDGSEWIVVKWAEYQGAESLERVRRHRDARRRDGAPSRNDETVAERAETLYNVTAEPVTGVTLLCHATGTGTKTGTESPPLKGPPPLPEGLASELAETEPPGEPDVCGKSPPAWWPDRYPGSRFADPEAWWDEFSRAFPRRAGDSKLKLGSEVARRILREGRGDLEERILAGALRYREFVEATGKLRTEFVQQVPTWLRGRGWEEAWEVPDDARVRGAPPPADRVRRVAAEIERLTGWTS